MRYRPPVTFGPHARPKQPDDVRLLVTVVVVVIAAAAAEAASCGARLMAAGQEGKPWYNCTGSLTTAATATA